MFVWLVFYTPKKILDGLLVRNDSILIPNRALSLRNLGGLCWKVLLEQLKPPPGALDLCRILRFGQVAGGGATQRPMSHGELNGAWMSLVN